MTKTTKTTEKAPTRREALHTLHEQTATAIKHYYTDSFGKDPLEQAIAEGMNFAMSCLTPELDLELLTPEEIEVVVIRNMIAALRAKK